MIDDKPNDKKYKPMTPSIEEGEIYDEMRCVDCPGSDCEKVTAAESQEHIRANEFYYKLWKCLKKALADEERLGCHCNGIVVQLGKSIMSGFTYYDPMYDSWCDYFLMTK